MDTTGESSPRYQAQFTPEQWQGDQAVETASEGARDWDCTRFALENQDYLDRLEAHSESLDGPFGAVDNDDLFQGDPAAPAWIRDWRGPFTIRIIREDPGGDRER
jgi:hypothetical protein